MIGWKRSWLATDLGLDGVRNNIDNSGFVNVADPGWGQITYLLLRMMVGNWQSGHYYKC